MNRGKGKAGRGKSAQWKVCIRGKSRSKLTAFVRLSFLASFSCFRAMAQGITQSDPFKKRSCSLAAAAGCIHCWLCHVPLCQVPFFSEWVWVWVWVCVIECAECVWVWRLLLCNAKFASHCWFLHELNECEWMRKWTNCSKWVFREREREWGSGEWVNAFVCFVHCRVTFLMKQQKRRKENTKKKTIKKKTKIEWGQIWNSFTANPAPALAHFQFFHF